MISLSKKPIHFPVKLVLQDYDFWLAARLGFIRAIERIEQGKTNYYGQNPRNCFRDNIDGALGEWCVSKVTKIKWNFLADPYGPDVGPYDVRTAPQSNHRMIIRPHEKTADNRISFFVTGFNKRWEIQGWLRKSDGMLERFWQDPTEGAREKAWFVPKRCLHKVFNYEI